MTAHDAIANYTTGPIVAIRKIDRVVIENDTAQIWGVFAAAKPDNRHDYLPPVRGYLYFTVGDNPSAAQKEWADLAGLAGSGQIVSFGSRWQLKARVRNSDAKPLNPDVYTVNTGVTRVRGNTEYAPIRALLDFRP